MKNPLRVAYEAQGLDPGPSSENQTIVAFGRIDGIDENGGSLCNTSFGGDCAVNPIIRTTCPGDVTSVSNVVLNACGGTVEHTFFMNPEIPMDWFSQEFRPVFDITRIADPLISPMAYCGNAQVINFANGVPMSTTMTPDSVSNLNCSTVSGIADDVCGISSGTSGTLFWGPEQAGAMALGIGNEPRDSLVVRYDFCLLCPEEIAVLEYQNIFDYAQSTGTFPVDDCHYVCAATSNGVCDVLNAPTGRWIDIIADSLGQDLNNLGPNVTIQDNRVPIEAVTATAGVPFSNLIASGIPAVSEEIQAVEICNPDPSQVAMGLGASVTLPSSVSLINVYSDAAGTLPLSSSLVSSTLNTSTYRVEFPSDLLDPNDCITIYIVLLFYFVQHLGICLQKFVLVLPVVVPLLS